MEQTHRDRDLSMGNMMNGSRSRHSEKAKAKHYKQLMTDLIVVIFVQYQFWSHPKRWPDKCVSLLYRVRQLTRNTEISNLHIAIVRNENVRRWIMYTIYNEVNNLPLMSLWIFRSPWRYSRPLRVSLSMTDMWVSSNSTRFLRSSAEPPPRYSITIHKFAPFERVIWEPLIKPWDSFQNTEWHRENCTDSES